MSESLLSPSRVLLYGRELEDLTINTEPTNKGLGDNKFLEKQIAKDFSTAADKVRIARIYAFSYEGHYYDLAKPALFMVHGKGVEAEGKVGGGGNARQARAPESADKTGVAAAAKSFSEEMRVWTYDKSDLSIRLDAETGTLEQILLDVELSTDRLGLTFSGKNVRLRGTNGGGD
jgi:hypothetical protein